MQGREKAFFRSLSLTRQESLEACVQKAGEGKVKGTDVDGLVHVRVEAYEVLLIISASLVLSENG